MRSRILRLLLPTLVVLAATVESVSLTPLAAVTPRSAAPSLPLTPCHVNDLAEEVRCGIVDVFEDRDRASGRTIPIHVAVLPALRRHTEPDPLFVLAGGPGQGAREMASVAARSFREIRRRRDIVLVDLRGTGASHPLACGSSGDELAALAENDPAKVAKDCAAGIDGDPRFYTHHHALADVNDVRERLGYERINLWGGSWGTRAALLFALRYPGATRTVTLDGAVALTLEFPRTASASAQRALDRLAERCAADADCRRVFPDPSGVLERFQARFAGGRAVTFRHPSTNEAATLALSAGMAADILRGALYSPSDAAAVLHLAERAADGDVAPLLAQYVHTASWSTDTMNLGATLAVLCSEDLSQVPDADFAADAGGSMFGSTYADGWRRRCEAWTAGPAIAEPRDATSHVPALILSGGDDPVTPPSAGELMARHFPNHRHIVVPRAAHNTSFSGCVPGLIARFIADGRADGLDDTCVNRISGWPFVLSAAGSQP